MIKKTIMILGMICIVPHSQVFALKLKKTTATPAPAPVKPAPAPVKPAPAPVKPAPAPVRPPQPTRTPTQQQAELRRQQEAEAARRKAEAKKQQEAEAARKKAEARLSTGTINADIVKLQRDFEILKKENKTLRNQLAAATAGGGAMPAGASVDELNGAATEAARAVVAAANIAGREDIARQWAEALP